MPISDDYLDSVGKRLDDAIARRQNTYDKALGLGERVKLTGPQKVAYFRSLPEAKRYELWGQMDAEEQEQIRQGMTGG